MNEWARVFTEQIAAGAGGVGVALIAVCYLGVDGSTSNEFACYTQHFELDADGTTRIKKFNYCAERTTNGVYQTTGGSQ